jgi:NTE family protein
MTRKRIAIACQGGGSQCAFVAGALQTFFALGVDHQFEIVGLSGTSGGALTAALAWFGMLKKPNGDGVAVEDRILAFWKDLSAQTPGEVFLDGSSIEVLRLVERGLLPSIASSPSSPQFQFWTNVIAPLFTRPEFTDLHALVVKHIDFEALPSLVEPESPILLVGAADVLKGNFKVFSSAYGEIKPESLLASAAIPNLFPAVWVDGHAYWDGIFSTNPPVVSFLQGGFMGKHALPEEIWILQVNPSEYESIPDEPAEIFDRRNHLAGNLSLRHELELVRIVNMLIEQHALTDEFRARFGFGLVQPITVRFVRMSEGLQRGLDYPSKLSRQPGLIDSLIADGEAQAKKFLSHIEEAERAPGPTVEGMSIEIH